MKELSYRRPGLILRMGVAAAEQQIRDLQRDLRQLGYLKNGIDGRFGAGTRPCDWPYALRRYNGGGINSYHYQTRVLKSLADSSF